MPKPKPVDMSKTVDTWQGPRITPKPHDSPSFTPDEIKAIQKRIDNWDKRNF